jgi:hypothetical protein
MPESVKTRSSSGPTKGAIVRCSSLAEELSGVVAMLRRILGDRNQRPAAGLR